MRTFCIKYHKLFCVLFVVCACLTLCGCSVNWVTEVTGAITAFGPSVSAFFALLSAFGAKIPANVLSTIQTVSTQITSDLENVVLPLIQQYNAAEADAKPGILGEIQSAMAAATTSMGTIETALTASGLSASDLAKATAVYQALVVQLNAIISFLPIIEGDEGSVKAAVKSGNVPMNAEQWATHFNQILAHRTGDPETDAVVDTLTKVTAPARA
jgi:hypothetical protein